MSIHFLKPKIPIKVKDITKSLLEHLQAIIISDGDETYVSKDKQIIKSITVPDGGILLYYTYYSPIYGFKEKNKGFDGDTAASVVLKQYDDEILSILDKREAMLNMLNKLGISMPNDKAEVIIARLIAYISQKRFGEDTLFDTSEFKTLLLGDDS